MDKNFNNSREDNLNFKDSWLQNTVELAVLGGLLTGAGTLAVKGDLTHAVKGSKRALGVMGKGIENYIRRNGSAGAKFGMHLGKGTFHKLKRMPTQQEEGKKELTSILENTIKQVKNDPKAEERIRNEVARRLNDETTRSMIDDVLDGTSKSKKDLDRRIRFLYEQARGGEIKKSLGIAPPEPSKAKNRIFSNGQPDGKPLFDARKVARDSIGSGIAGLAFAGGITGFHALDRLISDKENQDKVERSFEYAGSFLNNNDQDKKMSKSAGSLEFYNRLKEVGKKTPEAVASGLGFTGVSLGAAKAMNEMKEKKDDQNEQPEKTRVIIELGDTGISDNKNLGNHPTNMAGLPKFSSVQSNDLLKLAAMPSIPRGINKATGVKKFLGDFMGHGKQIEEFKALNPADIAASELKYQNVPDLLQQRYGNLVNDQTQGHFTQRLVDSKTEEVKRDIDDQIKNLETRTANARLKAGAGAVGLGGAIGVGMNFRKGDEQQ